MKRLMSLFLSLLLCLMLFPTTAFAAVSNEDLYMKYPYYIATNSEYNNLEWDSFQICIDIINAQDKFGKYEALVATLSDDGLSIGLKEVSAKLGWGTSYAKSIQESATEKFLAAISAENMQENSFNKASAASAKKWLGIYKDFAGPFKDDKELSRFLTEVLKSLGVSDTKVPALQKVLTKKIPKVFTAGTQGINAYQTILSLTAIYAYRMDSVKTLMASVDPSSDLYKGLQSTLDKMMDPAQYFSDHYTSKAVLGVIEGWLSKNASKFFTGKAENLMTAAWVYDLCKSLYFTFIYDGYKVDDYAEAIYLLVYTKDIDTAKNKLELEFLNGTAAKSDIQTHKDLVELSNISQIASLNAFAGLLSVRNRYDLKMKAEDQVALLLWNHDYDWFMKECKKDLDADLAAGKAVQGTLKDKQNQTEQNQPQPSPQPPSPSQTPSSSTSTTKPFVIQTVHCLTNITCPMRVVNLYLNPGDTSRYSYFSKGQNPRSQVYAKMSDGSTWYSVYVSDRGRSIDLWLKAEPDITFTTLHTFCETYYEDAHPHNGYHSCECGQTEYTGSRQSIPNICNECMAAVHSEHSWGTGTVTKPAGIGTNGTMTYTCSICGEIKTEAIPALNEISGIGENNILWTLTNEGTLRVDKDRSESSLETLVFYDVEDEMLRKSVNSIIIGENINFIISDSINNWPNLTNIALPDSLTAIYLPFMRDCPRLKSISIPASVTQIYTTTARNMNCPNLENFYVDENNSRYCSFEGVLYSKDMKELILVPVGRKTLVIPRSVTKIQAGAIPYDNQIETVKYEGSSEEWKQINFDPRNQADLKATFNFNYSPTGFEDIPLNSYYVDPVLWAVKNSVTSGTSTTTFSPNATCTNAQILTFLWRTSGSPDTKISNPFSNLTPDQYYYKAALWAYSNSMISGSTFDADTPCTRSRAVTYLWKCAGEPDSSKNTAFTDVSTGSDYTKAVSWAVKEGITAGTSKTTFSPDQTCTRAQIVTFLYRYIGS